MKNFYASMPNGQIVMTGNCGDNELELQQFPGATIYEGIARFDGHYRDDSGAVVAIPSAPSEHHVFSYESKTWIDPRTLEDHKTAAWERIKLARAAAEKTPFTYDGSVYDADQAHISGAVQGALLSQVAGQPFTIDWTLADNTIKTLNAEQMIGVGVALITRVSGIYDTARSLRTQIEACTTPAQADAITWAD